MDSPAPEAREPGAHLGRERTGQSLLQALETMHHPEQGAVPSAPWSFLAAPAERPCPANSGAGEQQAVPCWLKLCVG